MISRFLKASKTLRNKLNNHPGQKARARKRKQRLAFEALEDRRLLATLPPSPALLSTIEGFNIDDNAFNNDNAYIQPPDPFGAAGPAHIVNVGNTSIQWFTKDGTNQYHTSLKNFFAPLRPDDGIFDPKVLYDQYANRFVVVTLERYQTSAGDWFDMSRIMVAVSDDSDPNGKWYYHSINGMVNVPDPTDVEETLVTWTDYPGFALDEEALYITGNLFEFGTQDPYGNRLWIMDKGLGKGGFYDNGPAVVNMYDPSALTGVDFTGNYTQAQDFRCMQPAHVYGTAPAGVGTWLTLYDGLNNGVQELVDVIRIEDPLTTPKFTRTTINVGDIEDSTLPIDDNSPQRLSTARLDGGDRRVTNAVWRDNSLYVATVINPRSGPDVNQVTAHWFRFDTSNLQTLKLADQGNVGGEEIGFAAHTIWPAVNVDSQGNMVIGFSATGPTIHPGSYYAVRAPSDPAGTVRLAGTLAAGQDVFALAGTTATSDRNWGGYTSVALDPTDGVTFWLYNMYALPRQTLPGRWGTRWGSLRLADPAPPPTPGPVTIRGVVWDDQDEDRRRDATEPGLGGWVVWPDLDNDGERDLGEAALSVKTDSAGRYSITLDVTGSVTLYESMNTGWKQTFPGGTTQAQVVTVTGGGTINDINFGNSDNVGFDHGDAPAPYPTLEANNGAKHAIIAGFGLGVAATDGSTVVVDGEPDGLPDTNALGDDNNISDDENGVVFTTGLMPGKPATLTVTVSLGTNAPGLLQGWIDWNRDGDWADASEQVFKNRSLAAGTHTLTVNVPGTASPGTSYARFRYGHEKDLSYVGTSYFDGEVEDYRVGILSERPDAVDDAFTVERDSRENIFNVLANDVPGANGITMLRIRDLNMEGASGTATIDRNGTPDNYTDDFIRYTPRAGFSGSDPFSYTVVDVGNGLTDTARVTVTVTRPQGDAPVAVDDSYIVLTTADYPMPVLANDLRGPTGLPPVISDFDADGLVGTVTLVQNLGGSGLQGFTYTADPNFFGTEQFTYTIIDANEKTSTGRVTVQVGTNRINDDLVQFRLEAHELNDLTGDRIITSIGQGMQFEVWAYVQDMRNVPGYEQAPGLDDDDKGVGSAYMDLLYDAAMVSFAGVKFELEDGDKPGNYPAGQIYDAEVPGILNEVGAFQGFPSDPLGAEEKLLYKATFTAEQLGTVQFKTDPADGLPGQPALHETALRIPEVPAAYDQIEFLTTTINVEQLNPLVKIRLAATDLAGNSLEGRQIAPGTEFFVNAYVDDLGVRNGGTTVPPDQEGVFSAYMDINYDPNLARPVITQTGLGFDITNGPLFIKEGLKGTDWWPDAGIVDEVGTYQGFPGGPAETFSGEALLFRIRFEALGGAGGQLVFSGNEADAVVSETTLVNPYPGVSVPTAQILFDSAAPFTVTAGAGEGEFTNPNNRFDVNNDNHVTPYDALALVNFLNVSGTTALLGTAGGGEGEAGRMYYDVNSDFVVSAIDALGVINYLNAALSGAAGEGEAPAELPVSASVSQVRLAGVLPARDLLTLPRASTAAAAADSLTDWWLPEEHEETDYFAAVGADERTGPELSREPILSDALADDIAAAWGQSDAFELLPTDWL